MDNYSARALVQQANAVRTSAQPTELIEAAPHPLLGKRVKRRAYGPAGARTQRGIMCQHTGPLVLYLGEGRYRVTVGPGGTYVRTIVGRGVYSNRVDARHGPWELDE